MNVRYFGATRRRVSAVAFSVLAVTLMRADGLVSARRSTCGGKDQRAPSASGRHSELYQSLWSGQVHSLSRQGPDRRRAGRGRGLGLSNSPGQMGAAGHDTAPPGSRTT